MIFVSSPEGSTVFGRFGDTARRSSLLLVWYVRGCVPASYSWIDRSVQSQKRDFLQGLLENVRAPDVQIWIPATRKFWAQRPMRKKFCHKQTPQGPEQFANRTSSSCVFCAAMSASLEVPVTRARSSTAHRGHEPQKLPPRIAVAVPQVFAQPVYRRQCNNRCWIRKQQQSYSVASLLRAPDTRPATAGLQVAHGFYISPYRQGTSQV